MCAPVATKIPAGWQSVCLKQKGVFPCSLFCSPDGKQFKTIEEVHKYNSELEKKKIEEQHFSFVPNPPQRSGSQYGFVPVAGGPRISCGICPQMFVTASAQRKHIQDVHKQLNNNLNQVLGDNINCVQCKMKFPSPAEKLAHMNMHMNNEPAAKQTCNKCGKIFTTYENLKNHFQQEHSPPGPPMFANKTSVLDSRLQNFQLQQKSNENDKFNSIFGKPGNATRKTEPEKILPNIPGLTYSRSVNTRQILLNRLNESVRNVQSQGGQLPPNVPVSIQNAQNLVAVTQPFSIPNLSATASKETLPLPSVASRTTIDVPGQKQAISLDAMLAALRKRESEEKEAKAKSQTQNPYSSKTVPLRPQEPVKQEQKVMLPKRLPSSSEVLRKPTSGRVTKRRSETASTLSTTKIMNNSYNKFKISVSQVCRFLKMRDYPVPVTEERKLFFQQYERFESYYMPLLVSVNPGCDPLKLQTLARAKWREVVFSGAQPQASSLYFNKPKKNMIRVNILPHQISRY